MSKAQLELDKMRGSLATWLKYRLANDASARGLTPAPLSPEPPADIVSRRRDLGTEARMAKRLHQLLLEITPDEPLPAPDSPNAAVVLAQMVVSPQPRKSPTGFIPLLILGGAVMLIMMYSIKKDADVAAAKEKASYECIQSGRCTDSGFWLKWVAIGVGAWFVWNKTPVGDQIKGLITDGGERARRRVRG